MKDRLLTRNALLWVAFTVGHAFLIAAIWRLLDYVQSQLKVAPTELGLATAQLLSGLHSSLSWPFRPLIYSNAPEAILVGAAVIHFALWGAVWLGVWSLLTRAKPRSAHEG